MQKQTIYVYTGEIKEYPMKKDCFEFNWWSEVIEWMCKREVAKTEAEIVHGLVEVLENRATHFKGYTLSVAVATPVDKQIITISHAELNVIIDALYFACEQTVRSGGKIHAFNQDATLGASENLTMAEVADDWRDQLLLPFNNGSVDFIIDVNDSTTEFTLTRYE